MEEARIRRRRRIFIFGFVFAVLVSFVAYRVFRDPLGTLLAPVSALTVGRAEIASTHGLTHFLLVGIDRRKDAEGAGGLNDTLMLITLNQEEKAATILSIPRDLWVPLQDGQYGKINAAFNRGGVDELLGVFSRAFGISPHYYLVVDFQGFVQGVDILEGLDVYVEQTFDDYFYPIEGKEAVYPESDRYEHVHFDQGWEHMNGERALRFARSRHAVGPEGSDFARGRRQQKVILAAKEKALTLGTLFNPFRLKELYTLFGSSVETNITIAEGNLLYKELSQIADTHISTHVLDQDSQDGSLLYTPSDLSPYNNAWVLAPRAGDFSKIQEYVRELVSNPLSP